MLSYYHQYCIAIRTHNTTLFLKLFMPHFLCQFWCTFLCYSRWIPVLTNMVHFLYWIHLAFFSCTHIRKMEKSQKQCDFLHYFHVYLCVSLLLLLLCVSLSLSREMLFSSVVVFFLSEIGKKSKNMMFFAQVAVFLGLLKYLKWPNPDIFRAIRHVFYPFFSKGDCTEYFLCWLYIPAFPCSLRFFHLFAKFFTVNWKNLKSSLSCLLNPFLLSLRMCFPIFRLFCKPIAIPSLVCFSLGNFPMNLNESHEKIPCMNAYQKNHWGLATSCLFFFC